MGEHLTKKYGLPTAVAMVIGIVIGSGIFFKAEKILTATGGDLKTGMLAWLLGGCIAIASACAFAISAAMEESGLAALIADFIKGVSGSLGAWGALALLYLVTLLITELVTNNAAAALAFPLALETAAKFGVDPMPFFIAICVAASAGFATPIGYQTNLIVQGAGNYKFMDFVKIGVPMDIIVMIVSVTLIPLFWPFTTA